MNIRDAYSFGGQRITYLGMHSDGMARIKLPSGNTQLVDPVRLQDYALPITGKPVKWGHYLFEGRRAMISRVYRDRTIWVEGFGRLDRDSFMDAALPVPAWTKNLS